MDLIEFDKNNTNRHPWEISRASSIIKILSKNNLDTQYADIGAGDLYFSKRLAYITSLPIYSVDIGFKELYDSNNIITLTDINFLPLEGINCIVLMDVLEHVQDEDSFLENIHKRLNTNGDIIITVPSYQFLFSSHDIFLKHHRRYSRKTLKVLLEKNGFIVKKSFYFYSSLFFLRLLNLILSKFGTQNLKDKGIGTWRYEEGHPISYLIKAILNLDFMINYFLSKFKIILWGLSICMICKKK
jgi:hypothetical protein